MKTKRIALIMSTMILLSTCLTTTSYAQTNTSITTQTINTNIPSTLSANDVKKLTTSIDTVLSNKYQIMKNRKVNKTYISDEKLQQVLDSSNEFNIAWFDKVNLRASKYNTDVTLTEVKQLNDNKYLVKVNLDVTFTLKGSLQESSSTGEVFEFEVEKIKSKWYISKMLEISQDNDETENDGISTLSVGTDILLEEMSDSEYYQTLDDQLKSIDHSTLNMDKYANDITSISEEVNDGISTAAYSGYNPRLAVSYAVNWSNFKNPKYNYYNGNDCTNFVSQAVAYAGVPTTSTWKNGSAAFINVNKFYTYMRGNGYLWGTDSSSGAKLGDVIQLYNSTKKTWSHTVIITGKDNSGWLYCGHSSNRTNYPLAFVYPCSTYTNIRYMKFW